MAGTAFYSHRNGNLSNDSHIFNFAIIKLDVIIRRNLVSKKNFFLFKNEKMFFDLNSLNRIDRKRGGRNVVVRICSLLESVENTSSCTFEGRRFIMVS